MDNVFDSIQSFFAEIGGALAFDYLFFISLALLVVLIAGGLFLSYNSYQVKLLRTTKNMNAYLAKNPQINESNLIEFNNRMKRVPKQVRTGWMKYILERNNAPSHYININSCVDQQSRGNSYGNLISVLSIALSIFISLCLLCGVAFYANDTTTSVGRILFYISIIPVIVGVIGFLFISYLKINQNRVVENLYYQFEQFEKNMDSACKTLPMYIDPELLFTQKEIKSDDPIVTAYVNKKEELQQKEEVEHKLNEKQFEEYNFDDLGIENALLLEKAMKESEKYLSVKYDLEDKIRAKEDEMYTYTSAFDEVTKSYERKAQARREAIEQLNNQISTSTIAAETTFLRTRAVKEQEQLNIVEADYQSAKAKYAKQQETVDKEIEAYKAEIAKRKTIVEENMREQGKTYANKIYGELTKTVMDQNKPYFDQMEAQKQELETKVQSLSEQIEAQKAELEQEKQAYEQAAKELSAKKAEITAMGAVRDYFSSDEFIEKVSTVSSRQEKLETYARENNQIKREVSKLEEENLELANKVKDFMKEQQQVNAKTQQLARKQKELDEREKKASAKEQQIQELLVQLQQAKDEIVSLRDESLQEDTHKPETKAKTQTTNNIAKLQKLNDEIDVETERLVKSNKKGNKIGKSLNKLIESADQIKEDKEK